MAQLKINYGIDLGTTNSAIARMESGEPVVKKIEVTDDTMPSCVFFQKNKSIRVGKQAYASMKSDKRKAAKNWKSDDSNSFVEFKRTMGTNKTYPSSNMQQSYTSEQLSAEVLKTLRSFITDEDFRSVVITVPAKFTVNQKTATIEAAKLAGFSHVELLQEPIAAAMAYGLSSSEKDGYWLVFDFGGGTFDAALIKVEDGIIQVTDTEGDNYLGGKNLDYAIVDEILIPYLKNNYAIEGYLGNMAKKEILRDALKTYAEDIKNHLSFNENFNLYVDSADLGEDENGEEFEIDINISQNQLFDTIQPLFQKAVDICKELLKRNNLTSSKLNKVILVGGPTHSPLVRRMLKEQVSPNVETNIDPMTAVVKGAALYASTLDNEITEEDLKAQDVVLDLDFPSMTVDSSIFIPVKLKSGIDKATIQFVRHDNTWDSGKTVVDTKGTVIELNLLEGATNSFRIECTDSNGHNLNCFPNEITIIQGSTVGRATLPYDIALGVYDKTKKRDVTFCVKGLERNKTLPATGIANGLRTISQIRPGVDTDILTIPLYQVDHDGENKSVFLYEYIGEIEISGDDVDKMVQQNANIDITVKVDKNEQMTVDAYFPDQDIAVSKNIDTSKKQSISEASSFVDNHIKKAKENILHLKKEGHDLNAIEQQLRQVEKEHDNSSDHKMVMQHLKEVLRKIEDFENGTEWERAEKKLRKEFEDLVELNDEQGTNETTKIVDELRNQVDDVIRKKNVEMAHELTDTIIGLYVHMDMIRQAGFQIIHMDREFNSIQWKDRVRARNLIDQGLSELNNQPTADKLRSIVVALFELKPNRPTGSNTGIGK